MDFTITEEQKQIKSLVRQFCEKEVDLKQARDAADRAHLITTIEETRAHKPVQLLEKMHQVGLRQLAVPEKYGGGGAEKDFVTLTVATEEAGYSAEEVGFGLAFSTWFNCSLAANSLTEAQSEWYFSQYMQNHAFTSGGTASEPSGAADIHLPYDEGEGEPLKVTAHKDGSDWVINGNKMFGTAIGMANLYELFTRTRKDGPVSKSMTAFWIPGDAEGLTMIPNRVSDVAGNVQSFYDNVRVPETNMIGYENQGFNALMTALQTKTVIWAAFIGRAQKLFEQIVDFTKERVQGGKPLFKHSYIETQLARILIDIESTRALTYKAAWEIEQALKVGAPINMYWSQASLYRVKSMTLRVADIAADIYGGLAVTYDMPLQNFLRHAFTWQIGGTTRSSNLMKSIRQYEGRYQHS